MSRPDFLIVSADGAPLILVELKSRGGASEDWAAKYRRNYFAHGTSPLSTAFLLITIDSWFFWEPRPYQSATVDRPDFVIERERLASLFNRNVDAIDRGSFQNNSPGDTWELLTRLTVDTPDVPNAEPLGKFLNSPSVLAAKGGRVVAEPQL